MLRSVVLRRVEELGGTGILRVVTFGIQLCSQRRDHLGAVGYRDAGNRNLRKVDMYDN